jgi:hypothetical protein
MFGLKAMHLMVYAHQQLLWCAFEKWHLCATLRVPNMHSFNRRTAQHSSAGHTTQIQQLAVLHTLQRRPTILASCQCTHRKLVRCQVERVLPGTYGTIMQHMCRCDGSQLRAAMQRMYVCLSE